jgi:hypothetical protein
MRSSLISQSGFLSVENTATWSFVASFFGWLEIRQRLTVGSTAFKKRLFEKRRIAAGSAGIPAR